MAFEILTEDEQDETIVNFMVAQERDLHSHNISIDRFDAILLLDISTEFRARIEGLWGETFSRIEEVQAIIDATVTLVQLPSQARIDAALARIKIREERAR